MQYHRIVEIENKLSTIVQPLYRYFSDYSRSPFLYNKKKAKNFYNDIIVILSNNYIWTWKGERKLYFLLIGRNKIVHQENQNIYKIFLFVVLLFYKSVLRFFRFIKHTFFISLKFYRGLTTMLFMIINAYI